MEANVFLDRSNMDIILTALRCYFCEQACADQYEQVFDLITLFEDLMEIKV